VELAIVLVVLGLLIGIGAALIGPLTKQVRYRKTDEIIQNAKEAVIGFVLVNNRLPTAGPGGEIESITRTIDGWSDALVYAPAAGLTGAGTNLCCSSGPYLTVNDRNGTDVTNVAFIIYSTGEDHTDATAVASPPPDYNIQTYSAAYDDRADFVTVDELRGKVSCNPLQVRSRLLPEGIEDTSYSAQLEARGGCPPYSNWQISGGALPGGLALAAASGAITGTVSTYAGTSGTVNACPPVAYGFQATVDDSSGTTSQAQSFILNVFPQPLEVTNSDLPSGIEGAAYSATLFGRGGRDSYSWSITSGTLPPGLALDGATGVISGTPAAGSAGDYSFAATLSDGCSTTSKQFLISIETSSATNVSCTLSANPNPINSGQTTDLTYTITNGPADGSWSPAPGGTCADFTGVADGAYTCTTASLTSTATFTLTVDNGTSTNTCSVTVTVNTGCTAPVLSISPLPAALDCQPYSSFTSIQTAGTSPFSWAYAPNPDGLPNGISFCTGETGSICTLTGTPDDASGTYSFDVTASNACGSDTQTATLSVLSGCNKDEMKVRNEVGTDLWYSLNGGACTRWRNNKDLADGETPKKVHPGNTYEIYTDNACSNYCATVTFCNQKPYDTNGDCKTSMTSCGNFSDR